MPRKRMAYRGRKFLEEKGIHVNYPIGLEEQHFYKFEKSCNKCVKYILYSYRAKNPEIKRKYMDWAESYLKLYPSVYQEIKAQVEYKYSP